MLFSVDPGWYLRYSAISILLILIQAGAKHEQQLVRPETGNEIAALK